MAILVVSILVALIPGGLLWAIHEMQTGYFPSLSVMIDAFIWAATTGLVVGWLIVGLSMPYNFLGLLVSYNLTRFGGKIFIKKVLSVKKNCQKLNLRN